MFEIRPMTGPQVMNTSNTEPGFRFEHFYRERKRINEMWQLEETNYEH